MSETSAQIKRAAVLRRRAALAKRSAEALQRALFAKAKMQQTAVFKVSVTEIISKAEAKAARLAHYRKMDEFWGSHSREPHWWEREYCDAHNGFTHPKIYCQRTLREMEVLEKLWQRNDRYRH